MVREHYQMLGELARGGLGRILRARDQRTGRMVAIKEVLRPGPDIVIRFAREALVTANLQHPSIVPVYEVGRWPSGEPFYAMKLVRGRSLEDVVAETASAAQRIALLPHIIDVAEALAYAHGERIIHRDLKPANVLVGAYGETVVIDWGLAKNLATGEELAALPTVPRGAPPETHDRHETMAGSVLGTPAYMPPEQARGQAVDERSDVYAIGAILYQVLSGVRPYAEARSASEALELVLAGPPRPLAELAPGLPSELSTIVGKAMAPDPAQRYPTALGLAEDLRRFQTGQLVAAHRYSSWQLVARWVRRHRAVVATAAAGLLALAVFGAYSFHRIARERDEASRQRAVAERRLGDGLEELGRQALLAGEPERALPLLGGALSAKGDAAPVTRLLAGRARAAYRDLAMVFPAARSTVTANLTRDGKRLVTADVSGLLSVWDTAGGLPRWTRPGPFRARLSPDGQRIAAADPSGRVAIYATEDGAEGAALDSGDQIDVLSWSADSSRVAVAGLSGQVMMLGGGNPRAQVNRARVRDLQFSPDGKLLASAGDDATAIVDAVTLAPVRSLPPAVEVVWTAADRLIAAGTGDPGTAIEWEATTGSERMRFAHGAVLYGIALDARRGLLVTVATDTVAKVWDLASGALRAELAGHELGVNDGLFLGELLVTSDEVGAVRIWDPLRGELLRRLPADGTVWTLASDGTDLVVGGIGGRVRLWRAFTSDLTRLRGHTGRMRRIAFGARGDVLYTASNDGSARGFEIATGATRFVAGADPPVADPVDPSPTANPPAGPHTLRWIEPSPDGKLLAVGREDGAIQLYGAAGEPRGAWRGHSGAVRRVLFDSRGGRAFSGSADGTVRRWDVARGVEDGRIAIGAPVEALALARGRLIVRTQPEDVSIWDPSTLVRVDDGTLPRAKTAELVVAPDGTLVLGRPGVLELVDPVAATITRSLEVPFPFSVDLSADGSIVAVGNAGGEVTVLDWASGARLAAWRADAGIAAVARLRPDGTILATAGSERIVRIWEAVSGRLLAASPVLPSFPTYLAWSPDGHQLAVAGLGPDVWLWDLSPTELSGAELERSARCAGQWRLDGARLAASTPGAGACAP